MCGAIFEGVLLAKGLKESLSKKIEKARNNGIIDERTQQVMNSVNDFRNLVHAYKYDKSYVTRANAMDIRSVLDRIIVDFSME